jgi:TRAP-type C4-dicarboxylate transport system permease small subunit
LILKLEKWIISTCSAFNMIGALSIIVMMLLTCSDIVLRSFRMPIPGAYEMVGMLGALFVSFSLAQTSLQKGHIAVDFLVQKFSPKTRDIVAIITETVGAVLFALITWESAAYAGRLKTAGDVSMTLHIPTFPIVYGMTAGCGLLTLLLTFSIITLMIKVCQSK